MRFLLLVIMLVGFYLLYRWARWAWKKGPVDEMIEELEDTNELNKVIINYKEQNSDAVRNYKKNIKAIEKFKGES